MRNFLHANLPSVAFGLLSKWLKYRANDDFPEP
jgi:hypothetical protein